jgi:hypothetical protein
MKTRPHALALLLATIAFACTDVPIDDQRNDKRLFTPRGVIRGTVTYVGPRPCSKSGHIVGNAIVLVFDRRNPPPPAGIATSPQNFVAVPGDVLFANEPRTKGSELFCSPDDTMITASAPFTIAPLDPASYMVVAFYDRRGRFWPTFEFRNQPESGDLGGGYIDLEDARKNAGNPSYQPVYLPVNVGIPQGDTSGDAIPDFTIPENGYVADNVTVTVGSEVPFTRPYFHPEGAEELPAAAKSPGNPSGDPLWVPIVAMTSDIQVLAPPKSPTPQTLDAYQKSFRTVKLTWGVAKGEFDVATDPAQPFDLQLPALPPNGKGGLLVFSRGGSIPDNPAVPALWPEVAFVKLADDPVHRGDPQSLVVQGTPEEEIVTGRKPGPIVILQGITIDNDSLAATLAGSFQQSPTTAALRDHVTVMIRPAALCFDRKRVDVGGLLVTPHLVGKSADANEAGDKPLFDSDAVLSQKNVRDVKQACLPKGRYAMAAVYPTGQSWTVPNEMGGCARTEGAVAAPAGLASCTVKPRPVLLSQGPRAVLEIVDPADDSVCQDNPTPAECLPPP